MQLIGSELGKRWWIGPHYPNPMSKLASYSETYPLNINYSAEEDAKATFGMPGLFSEWTPDVRFFRSDEYPRVESRSAVKMYVELLPLLFLNKVSRTCWNLLMLRSSEVSPKHTETYRHVICPKNQAAFTCDSKAACETHKIALKLKTWVPCTQQGKGGCPAFSQREFTIVVFLLWMMLALVADSAIQGSFKSRASEHHLTKGSRSCCGKAFMTNQPCFSGDVTSYEQD
ncbi:hypothetical protein NC653_004968 [Populus alba x Populus x berolinensis]|uniref:NLP1-9 GAF domain-containing protein n=1 Tax=Populus alba x Populus x berolinensis TaxID=444605 RepID=A0AAD6WAI3_9ROSI|nr:hypothetical protein NC653_004968 [Populus alba x Populus x berolinensis]